MIFALNGDADGIFSFRILHESLGLRESNVRIVSDVKRQTHLIERVLAAENEDIYALDIELSKNSESVLKLINKNRFFWFDHHVSKFSVDEIINHINFHNFINTASNYNTSKIAYEKMNSKSSGWMISALFGDGLQEIAQDECDKHKISAADAKVLEQVGRFINYNSYGNSATDLFFHPVDICHDVLKYSDPVEFYRQSEIPKKIERFYEEDRTQFLNFLGQLKAADILDLPNEPWSIRFSGEAGNTLSRMYPDRTFAIVSQNRDSTYNVSVRSSKNSMVHIGQFCNQFHNGGGRAHSGGITSLPSEQLQHFKSEFRKEFKW